MRSTTRISGIFVIEVSVAICYGQVRSKDYALGEALCVYGTYLAVVAPSHKRRKSKVGALGDLFVFS
jgi:hypothetical protein